MSLYATLFNNVLQYIEDSLAEPLTLRSAAKVFSISEHHFSRLFRLLVGASFTPYVTGRKMTVAAQLLREGGQSVTETAYRLGYASPEVFSRAFKRQYGISPNGYRRGGALQSLPVERAAVINREIVNVRGGFALKGTFLYREEIQVGGVLLSVNENSPGFSQALADAGGDFLRRSGDDGRMKQEEFFSLVSCSGQGDRQYAVIFGKEVAGDCGPWQRYAIPGGWYAAFRYRGDMGSMRITFNDDYYRWIIAREIHIRDNGVGMLCIFDSRNTQNVKILVPAWNPKLQHQ